MEISEVAKKTGVPASTLRFYEEKGLIESIGRRGLQRVFAPNIVERLALIGLGRAAGFTLDEIALMFTSDGQPRIDRQVLAAKADEIQATITKLTKLRNGLKHAARCPAQNHLECPTFRRLLRAVASGALQVDHSPTVRRRRRGAARRASA